MPTYRAGRVFLAGGVRSPAGGMAAGARNAVSLGGRPTAAPRGFARHLPGRAVSRRRVVRTSAIVVGRALPHPRVPCVPRAVRDAALRLATRLGAVARRRIRHRSRLPGAAASASPSSAVAHRASRRRRRLANRYHALRPGRLPRVRGEARRSGTPDGRTAPPHAIAGGATRTAVLVRPDADIAGAGETAGLDGSASAKRAVPGRCRGPATDRLADRYRGRIRLRVIARDLPKENTPAGRGPAVARCRSPVPGLRSVRRGAWMPRRTGSWFRCDAGGASLRFDQGPGRT